jgi:hypothetical protein
MRDDIRFDEVFEEPLLHLTASLSRRLDWLSLEEIDSRSVF